MTDRDPLGEVDHTPPHDSYNRVQDRYQRGSEVPDGGRVDDPDDPDDEPQTLKDVDHSPPDGEGAHHVYRRGRTWK